MRDEFKNPLFSIGEHSYGEPTILTFDNSSRLAMGKFCSISDNVTILLGGNHRVDWCSTYPFPAFDATWPEAKNIQGHPASKGDITIGNDVWIGYGATILSGVNIGHGAVIGAMAVVTKDIAPYTVAAGNPAVEQRKRFTDTEIQTLLKLKWWDWSDEQIRNNVELLCSDQISELLKT